MSLQVTYPFLFTITEGRGKCMLNTEILKEFGFEPVTEGYYVSKIGEISVLLEETDSELKFIVYCAPARIDTDYEPDTFLKKVTSGTGCKHASYAAREIRLIFCSGTDEIAMENVRSAQEAIKKVYQEFDLLPSCMKCGRVTKVKMYTDDDKPGPICDVCRSEDALRRKHEKIIEASHAKPEISFEDNFFYSVKVTAGPAIRAGVKAGLIGGAIAFLFAMFGIGVNVFYLLYWIPGTVAGYLTAHNIQTMSGCLTSASRYVIGTISSLTTIFIISFIGMCITLLLLQGTLLINIVAFLGTFFRSFLGLMQIALGLSGFFIAEVFTLVIDLGD